MGLDVVELVMAVESAFDVEIPDADAERLHTVGLLYDYVRDRAAPSGARDGDPYSGALWDRYLDVLVRETGCERHELRPEARFVDDLGLD